MIQLAYVSSTRNLLSIKEIADILVTSRMRNQGRDITGMLLYKGGNVLQILEGKAEAVDALFQVILQDVRHSGVIELYRTAITERDFPEWNMAFHDLDVEKIERLEGFSPVLAPDFDMHSIRPSAAAELLSFFKSAIR